ncbi:MAG: type II toxin-antitoxin system VapC family toxin [Ilumatobacteraceae bacterium]
MRVAYVVPSVIVSYYLPRDSFHRQVVELFDDPDTAPITSAWSRIEVFSALVRATQTVVADNDSLLERLDHDLSGDPITMITTAEAAAVALTLELVQHQLIRPLDAWHIAVAADALPKLAGPGDTAVFYTCDPDRARAAKSIGLTTADLSDCS